MKNAHLWQNVEEKVIPKTSTELDQIHCEHSRLNIKQMLI